MAAGLEARGVECFHVQDRMLDAALCIQSVHSLRCMNRHALIWASNLKGVYEKW